MIAASSSLKIQKISIARKSYLFTIISAVNASILDFLFDTTRPTVKLDHETSSQFLEATVFSKPPRLLSSLDDKSRPADDPHPAEAIRLAEFVGCHLESPTGRTRSEAVTLCSASNLSLPVARTWHENELLLKLVAPRKMEPEAVWLGLERRRRNPKKTSETAQSDEEQRDEKRTVGTVEQDHIVEEELLAWRWDKDLNKNDVNGGTKISYANWARDEPGGVVGEDFGAMYQRWNPGQWLDSPADSLFAVLCCDLERFESRLEAALRGEIYSGEGAPGGPSAENQVEGGRGDISAPAEERDGREKGTKGEAEGGPELRDGGSSPWGVASLTRQTTTTLVPPAGNYMGAEGIQTVGPCISDVSSSRTTSSDESPKGWTVTQQGSGIIGALLVVVVLQAVVIAFLLSKRQWQQRTRTLSRREQEVEGLLWSSSPARIGEPASSSPANIPGAGVFGSAQGAAGVLIGGRSGVELGEEQPPGPGGLTGWGGGRLSRADRLYLSVFGEDSSTTKVGGGRDPGVGRRIEDRVLEDLCNDDSEELP